MTVVLVAFLGGMAWLIVHSPTEPSCEGKPLSYWLDEYRDRSGATVAEQISGKKVDEAIRHIGTNAVPFLLKMLQAKDSRIKSKLADFLNYQHVVKIHITTDAEQRWMAVKAFEALGAEAKPAVPELARLFAKTDPANRLEIGESLWRILPSRDVELNMNPPDRIYELSSDELLKALGPPTIRHEDWAAYDMGSALIPIGRAYLCIGFYRGRVLDSTVTGLSTNSQSPFIAPGHLLR